MAERHNERRPAGVASDEAQSTGPGDGYRLVSIVDDLGDHHDDRGGPAVYRTRPLRRKRRTKAEMAELHDAILTVCGLDHPLSVRGVFYRVLSAGAVEKTEKAYDAVQREALKLRRTGRLPYEWIVDGTRWNVKNPSWSNVEEALDDAASSYRRALWHDQDVYVEVWSEKEAISSIVSPITNEWDVPLMIARGFSSESFLWTTAKAMRAVDKPAIVFNLGDHDPSGVAAWAHVQAKLRDFAPGVDITFRRLAVTPEQIEELGLPTRPTKASDSRSKTFTGDSVEVDAIPTSVLRQIVTDAIESCIDPFALVHTRSVEASERRWLTDLAAS